MARSRLTSRFRYRTLRHVPTLPRTPGWETQLDLRPARFVVGMDEPIRWADLAGQESAPVCPAFYLGRVEEVVEGEVLATLWERPSGREATSALSVEEHFEGKTPQAGSLLRIWTWLELPGPGVQVPRIQVRVETPRLAEGQRRQLRELTDELKQEHPSKGQEPGGHDA